MRTPPTCQSRPSGGMLTRLFMVKRLLFVCLFMSLDIRDLYYKVVWQGPADSFSFITGSTEFFETKALVSTVTDDMRENGLVDSGWSSFLSRCDELYASVAEGSTFFLTASARNCRVPMLNGTVGTLSNLIMVSSVRVDSMAWAACRHLYHARRPQLCGDAMVGDFNKYYGFDDVTLPVELMAPPGSKHEEELLRLLDLIGLSYPMHKIVCVEAFKLDDNARGIFTPHIFGCASPNMYRAEFVGFEATSFHLLQGKKAWLTNDVLSILGWRYGIRQNCEATYEIGDATLSDNTKTISIRSISVTNFSSFGLLYGLVVLIDIILLFAHVRNIFELIKWMRLAQYYELQLWIEELNDLKTDRLSPVPAFPTQVDTASKRNVGSSAPFDETQLYAVFFRSFYRSPSYRVLLITTRLLAWLIIMPNSVIWTWSDSAAMKVMAYLCSIRSWILVSTSFSWIWLAVVKMNERMAYLICRHTHITNLEIIIICSLAALMQSHDIFSICEQKWHLETQRVNDFTSFQGGYLAHANTFQPTQHHESTTPFRIAWIIYWPLVRIVGVSIVLIIGWLGIKAILYNSTRKTRAGRRYTTREYARLALEKALNSPIRALSIVRYQLSMEVEKDGKLYIRPSCYLDYGIMLKTTPYQKRVDLGDIFKRQREVAPIANIVKGD